MFSIGHCQIGTRSIQVANKGWTLARFWNFCSIFQTVTTRCLRACKKITIWTPFAIDSLAPSHREYCVSGVVCHILPKNIDMETNYRVMVMLHSVNCLVLFNGDVSKEQVICKTCLKLQKKIKQQQERKEQTSNAPAKDKAPLAACHLWKWSCIWFWPIIYLYITVIRRVKGRIDWDDIQT